MRDVKINLLLLVLFLVLMNICKGYANNIDSLQLQLTKQYDRSKLYNELAEEYKSNSQLDSLKLYADSARIEAIAKGNQLEEGNAYINIGDYHYYVSQYDSSIYHYNKAVSLFQAINQSEEIASAYSNIGAIYYTISDFDKAIYFFRKAAEYQKINNDLQELAIIYNNIATVYYQISDYANSIEYFTKSLDLKIDNNSIAKGLNNIASVYEKIGSYDKAIDYYYKSIRYSDQSNDEPLKATTLNNIAGAYKDWGQYKKALELYNEALHIKTKLKDLDGKANLLNNIGLVYKLKRDNSKAIMYFNEAKTIFEQVGNLKRLAITFSNIGAIKEQDKEYNRALNDYTKSLEISKQIKSPYNSALGYLNVSRIYLKMNNLQKAELFLNKCIIESREHELNSIEIDVFKMLSELYQAKKEYKKALDYYKQYEIIKDSIFTIEKHKQLNKLNTQYETDKKNKAIEFLNIQTKQQELEIKAKQQERNLWLGISILAFFIGVISLYFYINKKKLSDKLKKKNDFIEKMLNEKDILLREIHHRVKNNLQIISSLLNMQSKYLSDEKTKAIVTDSQNRIKSMSLIHQKLYQEENLTGIDTNLYFTELIDSLSLSYGLDKKALSFVIEIEPLFLDVDTLIPLGLIVNEVITNAFKYGVDKNNGAFTFIFRKVNEELDLFVKDNGQGIHKDFEPKKSKSYGMKLIHSLGKKLKADIHFKNNQGLEISMIIHKFKIAS